MCQKTCVPVTLQALRSWNATAATFPPTLPVWLACKRASQQPLGMQQSVKVKSVPSEGSERRQVPGKSQTFQTSSVRLRKRYFHAAGMLSSEGQRQAGSSCAASSSSLSTFRPHPRPTASVHAVAVSLPEERATDKQGG